MTTITYKDGKLCSDSKISYGDGYLPSNFKKIVKIGDNYYGFCGNLPAIQNAISFLSGNSELECYEEEVGFLEVKPSGKAFSCNVAKGGCVSKIEVKPPVALGSGNVYALAAMLGGASAKEAVKIASKFDHATGGKVLEVIIK